MPGTLEVVMGDNDDKHVGDITCVAYNNGFVFTGGCDGKIKIWDKDLKLIKTLNHHETFVYALAISPSGKLYSSSSDGFIKYVKEPLKSDDAVELFRSEDAVESLIYSGDRLFSGDGIGLVGEWENDKIVAKYNLVEQVKSLAVENNLVYTARESDAVITEINPKKPGVYTTKATIPGRAPLVLLGPVVKGTHSFIGFATRDGKGLTLATNLTNQHFAPLWTKENCHTMLINSIVGNDKSLYSAGYDGVVKRWGNLDTPSPKLIGEVTIGSCINSICLGEGDTIYTGSSDGVVRKLFFTD